MIETDTVEIFCSVIGVLLLLLTILFAVYRKNKKKKHKITFVFCLLLVFCFCWGWFVPIELGEKGEAYYCKFRFQIYSYDTHDYNGDGELIDWLFLYNYDNSHSKYGSIHFQSREGGVQEYFGFKEIN